MNKYEELIKPILKLVGEVSAVRETIINSIPRIEFPKINLPKIEIDYEKIERVIINNSRYGWTLTGEIGLNEYLNEDLLEKSLDFVDNYFYQHYSENDWRNFRVTKEEVINGINPKWKELVDECFHGIENDKYKVVIPTLISVIEGEISEIAETNDVGGKLIRKLRVRIDTDKDKFDTLLLYSLYSYIKGELFTYSNFLNSRPAIINRNWVMHGRDDPNYWSKTDAIRLINVLSTIQLAKETLNLYK